MKRYCLLTLLIVSQAILAADTLPLSDTQIQTLSHYYTSGDNSSLIWKGDPLAVALPVNTEKRLLFPESVEVNLNGSLTTDQLRVVNNDKSVYLTALKPFATTRMYVTLKASQKILLLDISTADKASNSVQTVVISSDPKSSTVNNPTSDYANSTVSNVAAIRFAWQQLYAPQRLLNNANAFTRTPMHTHTWLTNLVYGDKVLVHPLISWTAGNLFVTAIELRNKYPHTTVLDLRHDLCGEWQVATLYPRATLKPAGHKMGDSATLFVISSKPFGESMEACHGSL